MSGPKVVRVVTREEVEAICQRQIALADAAIRQVRATVKRHDLVERELENALSGRREELVRLLGQDEFIEIQKRAPMLADFCRAEALRIEAKAVAAIEAARSRRRRLSDAARSLIAALEARGSAPSAELRAVVADGLTADESRLDEMERTVAGALQVLASSSKGAEVSNTELGELAKRLGAGEHGISLGAWLAQNNVAAEENDGRLDKVLAELELLGDLAVMREYSQRAARIASDASISQRRLLTDSLIIDASNAARQLRAVEAYRTRLRDVHAALLTCSAEEARQQAVIVAQAIDSRQLTVDEGVLAKANAAVEQAQAELAAAARRRAILGGLAALGYEVREGMATAWTRNGRLVVKKPNAIDYGVELAAPEDASRLQVRLVGAANAATARNPARDRDQEAMWCSEFGKLRELVAAAGGNVLIERALAVGTQPVKIVTFDDIAAADAVDIGKDRQHSL